MLAMKAVPSFHYSDLLSGIDDSLSTISCLLDNSKQARSDYSSNWLKVLEAYETDIAQFDNMLEQLPLSHRRTKKNKRNNGNTNHHALNFHIQQGDNGNAMDDVFILPPSSDELNSKSTLDDSMSQTTHASKADSNHRNKRQTLGKIRKEEERIRFNSRENMLENLNVMKDNELEIERLLEEGKEGTDNPLEDTKRVELQETLDKCKQQQSRQIIHWVTSYRPRKNIKVGKKLSQLCPSIKGVLNDLNKLNGIRDKRVKRRVISKTRVSKKVLAQFPAYKQGGNDKRSCEMIMNDTEQFMSLEDLPFRPLSAAVSKRKDHLRVVESAANTSTNGKEKLDDGPDNKNMSTSNSIDYDDDYENDDDDDDAYDDDGDEYESDYAESFEDE